MYGKHADVNSFPMLAIDQEVFYIKVEVRNVRGGGGGGHGCIYAPRRPFF